MTGQGMSMFFTHRRFRAAGFAASSLTLIAAVGIAIADAPSSGRSTPIAKTAPQSDRPNSVAINPTEGTDPGLQLRVPGQIADPRSVRGPQARLFGDTAGAVRVVRGPQATLVDGSADRGTVAGPQATRRPGNTADGGTAPGQTTVPGDTARGGTVLGAHLTLLGMGIGAQATLR
jgi:hypothetical protein